MFSLCHPWFTTTNLSYTFPILETSATASCGSTGIGSFGSNHKVTTWTCSQHRRRLHWPRVWMWKRTRRIGELWSIAQCCHPERQRILLRSKSWGQRVSLWSQICHFRGSLGVRTLMTSPIILANGDGIMSNTIVHPAPNTWSSLAIVLQTFWRTQIRKTTSKRHQSTFGLQYGRRHRLQDQRR